jgi:hypothetical protein
MQRRNRAHAGSELVERNLLCVMINPNCFVVIVLSLPNNTSPVMIRALLVAFNYSTVVGVEPCPVGLAAVVRESSCMHRFHPMPEHAEPVMKQQEQPGRHPMSSPCPTHVRGTCLCSVAYVCIYAASAACPAFPPRTSSTILRSPNYLVAPWEERASSSYTSAERLGRSATYRAWRRSTPTST